MTSLLNRSSKFISQIKVNFNAIPIICLHVPLALVLILERLNFNTLSVTTNPLPKSVKLSKKQVKVKYKAYDKALTITAD